MNYPPKTLLISPFFDAALPSGGVLYSVNLAREWLARGRQVMVLCGQRNRRLGPLQEYADRGQLILRPIVTPEQIRFSHHSHPEVGRQTANLIRAFQPDVIHVHNFQGMLAGVQAAVDADRPVLMTALDFGLLCFNFCLYDGSTCPCAGPGSAKACVRCIRNTIRGPASWLGPILPRSITTKVWPRFVRLDQIQTVSVLQQSMQRVRAGVDLIVAPSPITYAKLAEFGVEDDRLVQMLYGLPAGMMVRPAKTASTTLRLAYLGGGEPIKGFQLVADAAGRLPDGLGLEIRVFGGPAMAEKVEQSSPAARRYLRHHPPVFGPSLAAEHARIDAVLVPSLVHDNSPFVVLEALANGTAILAADQAGIRHLVEAGRSGWHLPPADPQAWADAMVQAATMPEVVRAMQRQAAFTRTISQYVDDLDGHEQRLIERYPRACTAMAN